MLVRPLVDTPVTPNHLTTLRLVTGLLAGAGFAVGTMPWAYAGCGAFVLSMLLDRADGELARLTGQMSAAGHRYDLMADTTCNAWALVGIGLGLRQGPLGWWAVPAGLVAGTGVATVLWLVLRAEAARGARAAELSSFRGFDVDDLVLTIPIGVAAGAALPLLLVALVATPLFAGWLAWRLDRRHAVAGPGGPRSRRPGSRAGAS